MPIRTNRGRAAVYRRLWGWPMRSPTHLAVTLLVLAVLITGIGIAVPTLFGGGSSTGVETTSVEAARSWEPDPDPDSEPGAGDGSTSGSTPVTRLTAPVVTPSHVAPAPEALSVAEKWAEAWVHHPKGITTEAWLDGLEPYTTREFLPTMSTVQPANIPSDDVTGDPRPVSSFAKSVVAIVPTDGPDLRITVVNTDYGWRVGNYERAG